MLDNIVDSTMASFSEGLTGAGDQGVAQLGQDFYDQLAQKLGERIRAMRPARPGHHRKSTVRGTCVLANDVRLLWSSAGFAARADRRGYTDLCAALCAVGLAASELQVWKEVDGIFTADPRKVPSARLVPIITPDEAAELTYYGSEVIPPVHHGAGDPCEDPHPYQKRREPPGPGHHHLPDESFPRGIDRAADSSATDLDSALSGQEAKEEEMKKEGKLPTAVTIKDSMIVVNIHSKPQDPLAWLSCQDLRHP